MKRQDLNGYRKPEEVVRRFDLSKIELNSEDIEKLKEEVVCDDFLSLNSTAPVENKIITAALNNKVTKEHGKGLSTNDFTDEDVESIHIHLNKSVLDQITNEKITNWDNLNTLYSVGSIYMSKNSTAPVITGMTWTSVGTLTVGTTTIYVYERTM